MQHVLIPSKFLTQFLRGYVFCCHIFTARMLTYHSFAESFMAYFVITCCGNFSGCNFYKEN